MPDPLQESKNAEKDYRWVKTLTTTVYNVPNEMAKKKGERKAVANLFVGDWTKLIESGEEVHISFRGGEGYTAPAAVGNEEVLEIYFIDVGQGDAILLQTADDKRILIDGGKDESAYSFIHWKYNLDKYHKDFDAVIMTHSDADHSAGLIPLLNDKHVLVRRIYHNGIARRLKAPALGQEGNVDGKKVLVELFSDVDELQPRKGELTPLFKTWVQAVIAARENARQNNVDLRCLRADQNTEPLVLGEEKPLKVSFLNPINVGTVDEPRLMRVGSDSETINGNSVAVLVQYGKAKILLCGDMNDKSEKLFLQNCRIETPMAHVFKANHHGSQHFSTEFLRLVQPWITVVSSGNDPDYGHPRANLLGSLGRYAPEIIEKPLLFSTEVAATFKRIKSSPEEKGIHLYEQTTRGLINVRTNGEWLAAGRVYNKRKQEGKGPYAKSLWDWERYAFNLNNAKPLTDKLLET